MIDLLPRQLSGCRMWIPEFFDFPALRAEHMHNGILIIKELSMRYCRGRAVPFGTVAHGDCDGQCIVSWIGTVIVCLW